MMFGERSMLSPPAATVTVEPRLSVIGLSSLMAEPYRLVVVVGRRRPIGIGRTVIWARGPRTAVTSEPASVYATGLCFLTDIGSGVDPVRTATMGGNRRSTWTNICSKTFFGWRNGSTISALSLVRG